MILSCQKVIRSSATQCASAEDDSSVCQVFLLWRQLDNLSVDDSRSSQSLLLLLSIILGSVLKTTSLQVTAKTTKTIHNLSGNNSSQLLFWGQIEVQKKTDISTSIQESLSVSDGYKNKAGQFVCTGRAGKVTRWDKRLGRDEGGK